jgi:O-methyltransferase involved in polyketide biosynthesis
VAQAIAPESKIVYVDSDPLVIAHARALLTSSRQGACEYVEADLRDPETILKHAAQTLDYARPVAVLLVAVLHFCNQQDDPQKAVAALASAMAPGSFVAISHPPATGWETDVEPRRRPTLREQGRQQAMKRQPGTTPLVVSVRPGLPRRKARLPNGTEACSRLLTRRQRLGASASVR